MWFLLSLSPSNEEKKKKPTPNQTKKPQIKLSLIAALYPSRNEAQRRALGRGEPVWEQRGAAAAAGPPKPRPLASPPPPPTLPSTKV